MYLKNLLPKHGSNIDSHSRGGLLNLKRRNLRHGLQIGLQQYSIIFSNVGKSSNWNSANHIVSANWNNGSIISEISVGLEVFAD